MAIEIAWWWSHITLYHVYSDHIKKQPVCRMRMGPVDHLPQDVDLSKLFPCLLYAWEEGAPITWPWGGEKQAHLRSLSFIIMQSYCLFFFMDTERLGTEKREKRRNKEVPNSL